MTTARTIIKKALQKNGVLTKNESPSGDEASDGLDSLNALLSSWSNDSLLSYYRESESFPLVGSQATYTIGIGGVFNTVRPIQIISAYIRIGGTDYTLSCLNGQEYDKILQKDIRTIPDTLFYDGNSPLSTITLYPVPTTGTLFIRSEKELTQLPTLDSDLEFPAGWERALIYNLAVDLSGEYGQQIDQITYKIANEAKGGIKSATARNRKMNMYPENKTTGNIYSGWYS